MVRKTVCSEPDLQMGGGGGGGGGGAGFKGSVIISQYNSCYT